MFSRNCIRCGKEYFGHVCQSCSYDHKSGYGEHMYPLERPLKKSYSLDSLKEQSMIDQNIGFKLANTVLIMLLFIATIAQLIVFIIDTVNFIQIDAALRQGGVFARIFFTHWIPLLVYIVLLVWMFKVQKNFSLFVSTSVSPSEYALVKDLIESLRQENVNLRYEIEELEDKIYKNHQL